MHPHPFYTPIATFGSDYMMEPVAYGLKFAGALSGGSFVKGDFTAQLQAAGVDATAYVAKLPGGETSLIVLNKDADKDLVLSLEFSSGKSGKVETETLHAPALDSREATITRSAAASHLKNGRYTVSVARASGVRLIVS